MKTAGFHNSLCKHNNAPDRKANTNNKREFCAPEKRNSSNKGTPWRKGQIISKKGSGKCWWWKWENAAEQTLASWGMPQSRGVSIQELASLCSAGFCPGCEKTCSCQNSKTGQEDTPGDVSAQAPPGGHMHFCSIYLSSSAKGQSPLVPPANTSDRLPWHSSQPGEFIYK